MIGPGPSKTRLAELAALLGAIILEQPFDAVIINFTMPQGFLYVPAVDVPYWLLTVEMAFDVCMWGLWRLRAPNRIKAVLIAWIALRPKSYPSVHQLRAGVTRIADGQHNLLGVRFKD